MAIAMQVAGAYVEQIPVGAKPPVPRITAAGKIVAPPVPPAGLYVQVADVRTQDEAVRASLALAQRLGAQRPRFVRGEIMRVAGQARIFMYAGPFGAAAAASAFCAVALSDSPCVTRDLKAGRPPEPPPPEGRQKR